MTAKKAATVRKAAPRKAVAKPKPVEVPVVEEEELSGDFTVAEFNDVAPAVDALQDAARDLALDYLFKRAFKFGAVHHARTQIDMAKVPDEVKTVLYAVIDRNES